MAVEELMQLKLERRNTMDMISGKQLSTVELCISVEQLKAGLIKEIGSRNFAVLLAIASHLNEQRVAFPNITEIVDITGLSSPTVIKAIQELEEVTVGGQHIIKKSKLPTQAGNTKSLYHFAGAEIEAAAEPPEMTAKDVILLFCHYFEETYGVAYNVTWGRDMAMVNKKLVEVYTAEQLQEIVRIAVTKYSRFSNSPQYPTPTLGMLCSWLANKAAGELVTEQKKEKDYQSKVAFAEKAATVDSVALLDL